ncbi:MAG: glucose 1-dehydrogenase [Pseudomonadota bacterium]|nr:glucose 1-dehydrogenase [Pseudomonadota bacterium]
MLLENRIALVTGGGRGNGASIARGLARHGAAVAVLDRDRAPAEEIAKEIRDNGGKAEAFVLDVTDYDAAMKLPETVAAALGEVSILVNNAGVIRRAKLDDPDVRESFDECMSVNVGGVFNMSLAMMPHLRATKGCIINISSVVAFVTMDTFVGYAASKAALFGITRNLARQLAPDGVRVNAVAPGPFETPMTKTTTGDDARREFFRSKIALGRWGDPDEMIGPVVFLASDMASFVTGVTLPVDGGVLTG